MLTVFGGVLRLRESTVPGVEAECLPEVTEAVEDMGRRVGADTGLPGGVATARQAEAGTALPRPAVGEDTDRLREGTATPQGVAARRRAISTTGRDLTARRARHRATGRILRCRACRPAAMKLTIPTGFLTFPGRSRHRLCPAWTMARRVQYLRWKRMPGRRRTSLGSLASLGRSGTATPTLRGWSDCSRAWAPSGTSRMDGRARTVGTAKSK